MTATAPALSRRLACLVYEGVLLFGIVMAAGLVYSIVTGQRHALHGLRGMQIWIFVVLGIYFVGFWTRRGQTLPMQTWQIRLVTARDGTLPSLARATLRYVLGWVWFLPALAIVQLSGLKSMGALSGVLLAGMLTYAALSRLHPQRQFWHDALCGTRLIDLRSLPPPAPGGRPRLSPASPDS
jgi:uncharacterized RDD family membrane protein YckC